MSCSRRRLLALVPNAALAGVLAGSLEGCGGGRGGTDGSVTVTGGKATLSFAEFPTLQNAGGAVIVDTSTGEAISVIRTSSTAVSALSAVCTHQGCYVEYVGSSGFACPCHGAAFSASGVVTRGPARSNLARFTATLDAAGITVAGL